MQSENQQVKEKTAVLLYRANKPKRGTAFEVYTDGTVVIKTKITKPGIHIPKKALQWMKIGNMKEWQLLHIFSPVYAIKKPGLFV